MKKDSGTQGWFIVLLVIWGICSLIASCNGKAEQWREAEEAQERLDKFAQDISR